MLMLLLRTLSLATCLEILPPLIIKTRSRRVSRERSPRSPSYHSYLPRVFSTTAVGTKWESVQNLALPTQQPVYLESDDVKSSLLILVQEQHQRNSNGLLRWVSSLQKVHWKCEGIIISCCVCAFAPLC